MKIPQKTLVIPIVIALILISACQPALINENIPEQEPNKLAIVTFKVTLPNPLPPGESVYLSELDEITGLPFNSQDHIMEAEDNQHFIVKLPLRLNSLFRYRYMHKDNYAASEFTLGGLPVRYRLLHVIEPTFIQDTIGKWSDVESNLGTGRIIGQIIDAETNHPLPDMLVFAGGVQTSSLADGSFEIPDLPAGIHHLVVLDPTGSYGIVQQGANVAVGAATQANLALSLNEQVNITFIVEPPDSTPPNAVIRMAGSTRQMGNMFIDLQGGVGHTSSRLPELKEFADGKYAITLSLPVGREIRYKYTLGDGVWNAEQTADRNFSVRLIEVPNFDAVVNDKVIRWDDGISTGIVFTVEVPETTPEDEIISIQFNPGYDWLEPVSMWPVGRNRWQYTLFSPIRGLTSIHYRYCRDYQCGSADDIETPGNLSVGRELIISAENPLVNDLVTSWVFLDGAPKPAVVPNLDIQTREPGFVAGITIQRGYHPSWINRLPAAIDDIKSLNANYVILQPSWVYTDSELPYATSSTGTDLNGPELYGSLNYLRANDLQTGIFPILTYPNSPDRWWKEAPRDFSWWVSWFENYRQFIRHHALTANRYEASTLILGDPSISPALPGGSLFDESPSNLPEDADTRWIDMIEETRLNFNGQIWWAVPFANLDKLPAFISELDGIYIIWSAPLNENGKDLQAMIDHAESLLDRQVHPVQKKFNKPIILAFNYPSATGGSSGCLPATETGCLPLSLLSPPNIDIPHITRDLDEQENAYNAMFQAVNERLWINGVVSQEYFFPVPLQDKSTSIHGKPTRGVLWYWFGEFAGK